MYGFTLHIKIFQSECLSFTYLDSSLIVNQPRINFGQMFQIIMLQKKEKKRLN